MCTKSGQNLFLFFGEACRSISKRRRCTTVLKFHQFGLPFEKRVVTYFHLLMYMNNFVCHHILYFLPVITLDNFCILSTLRPVACSSTSCYTRASPKQLLLRGYSNVAHHTQRHQVISRTPCFTKQAKSAIPDLPDPISKQI